MKRTLSVLTLTALAALAVVGLSAQLSRPALAQQPAASGIADSALEQIAAITAMKQGFTPAQNKIDSNLVFATKAAAGELAGTSLAAIPGIGATDLQDGAAKPALDLEGNVTVDIRGKVSAALLDAIASAGGVVSYKSARWRSIRASLPLGALETVAANADVASIRPAARAQTNAGALTSQGYISHRANQVVAMGINGAGVTVGVLSDSASPARVAALIGSGDLPAATSVLPGQDGGAGSDEGTAMMEIVHDIAPGANLIFATAFSGEASFADNIIALQAAGAKVIVDDVTYFAEGAFQDGTIAQAVNQVTASGALYFSSSANSGSLTFGTSGTWEGDFVADGPAGGPLAGAGTVHSFGPQDFDVLTVSTSVISLKWSDPLGASTNDYDLYILNPAGTAVTAFSAGTQDGTQDPFELVFNGPGFAANSRIVVVQFSGATRALRLDSSRGELSINTAGSTFGHNAGANTMSTAATYWNSAHTGTRPFTGFANPNEVFSSDGPRKIFFNPNGTPITPGNFLFGTNGGTTLAKPDIAAADGNSAKTPGFLPFFGTSAAAPHAAGIAALVFQVRPAWTPAQVRNAIKGTALDSMAVGVDRDSGAGIAMALPAVQFALAH
jgi:subtilisin family serine protease